MTTTQTEFGDDPWLLRKWRTEVARCSLRKLVERSHGSISLADLSRWENGERLIDHDRLQDLDRAYRAGGALVGLARAGRSIQTKLPPRRTWWSNFTKGDGAVWAWLRYPDRLEDQHVTVRWGVLFGRVRVPREGLILTCPVSVNNPPARLVFDDIGWADFGTGRIPRRLKVRKLNGLARIRAVDVTESVVAIFRDQLTVAFQRDRAAWLTPVKRLVGKRADLVDRAFMDDAPISSEPLDLTQLGDRTVCDWPLVPAIRATGEQYEQLRIRRCLSGVSAAQEATEMVPEHPVTSRHVGALEQGHHPRVRFLDARIDVLFSADGRTVFEKIDTPDQGRTVMTVHFPPFWRGAIAVQFNGPTDALGLVCLQWAPWERRMMVSEGTVVATRCADPAAPLTVYYPQGWSARAAIGECSSAVDINIGWTVMPELGAHVFTEYAHVYLALFRKSLPQLIRAIQQKGR